MHPPVGSAVPDDPITSELLIYRNVWRPADGRAGRTVHVGFDRAARAALHPVNLFASDTLPAIGARLPPG
jgi:hypothetical protein